MAIGVHIVMLLLVVNSGVISVSIAKGLQAKPMKTRINEYIQGDGTSQASSIEAQKFKRFYEEPGMLDSSESFESGKNRINENIHDDGTNDGDSWHKHQPVKRKRTKKRNGQRKVKERPFIPIYVRETHG